MSALPRFVRERADISVVLLGVGVVGSAFLRLLRTPAAAGLRLVGLASSTRQRFAAEGLEAAEARDLAGAEPGRDDAALLAALGEAAGHRSAIIDATASREVGARHTEWLAAGYDVVTANKHAAAAPSRDFDALTRAARVASYGDSATVGAGLPVLATLRRLRACGDAPSALSGVFSGSLSWLFNQYDGSRPFSALLREARAFGYTEPDPRFDLAGTDVARKLVILARAAGRTIEIDEVEIENLVPATLRDVSSAEFIERADELDDSIERCRSIAASQGCVLRHVASLDEDGVARVALTAVAADHPAARLSGTDNLFALTTPRYRARPLVIQGPGAGAEVTAQALLGDLLALRPVRSAVA